MALFSELPHTRGHETAGVISAIGEGMEHWSVGDRVGMAPMMPDGTAIGFGPWEGGFGPKLRATDANLVRLPDEVPFDAGAMATDAALTADGAVVSTGALEKGMMVGIIGLSGLGHIGAKVAAILGAEVYGAEINPQTRDLAPEMGVAEVAESILAFRDVGLDLVVDFAGFGTMTAEGVTALRKGGTLVQVGMGRLEARLNTDELITKTLTVKGSDSGTTEDLAGIYELMRSGQLNPPMNLITQAEIPEAIEKLRAGGVIGRFIAVYDD